MRVVYPAAWPLAHHHAHHPVAGPGWLGVLLIGIAVAVLLIGGLGGVLHRAFGRRAWVTAIVLGIPLLVVVAGGAAWAFDQARRSAGTWAWPLLIAAAVLLAVLAGGRVAFYRVRYGRRRPWLSLQRRLAWRMHPGPGWASRWALWRAHGLPAARKVARHARPSLSWLGRRMPGAWRGFAAFDGWGGGWLIRQRVYSPVESMRLIIAPPQEGKSAAAAGTILDAPGAAVATSIRGDLIAATAGLRSRVGQLHIWNPEGVGDYASTVAWNPVEGCTDMVTAVRHAGYMVEASTARGLSDESFWRDQDSLVLASYLHATALAGGDLVSTHRWVLEEDEQPVRILARHSGAEPQALSQVTSYLKLPDRTRAGISATINNTLKFMQHPGVVAAITPAPGEGFDFEAFLAGSDTLYLVAADADTSPVSPLFVALCAEITWHARQIGGIRRPARAARGPFRPRMVSRLDPPLTMVLDEVATIAPVPAAAWATWAAGSGVWLHLYAQAWAQLVERWGQAGAAVIWQACKAKMVYSATTEPDLGQMVEDACGTVRVRGPDDWRLTRRGKTRRVPTWEKEPLLPHAELRQLPQGHAVLIQGSAPPVIVRPENFWKRADVKAWQRQNGPLTLPRPVPRPVPEPVPGLLAPEPPAGDLVSPDGPGWPGPQPRDPGRAPHWTDGVPEIPRELFLPPPAAEPQQPPAQPPPAQPPAQPRKKPQPPTRPAPWERERSPGPEPEPGDDK